MRGVPSKVPRHVAQAIQGPTRPQRRTLVTRQSRNAAIQAFFRHLESNYGNLPSLLDAGPAAETIVSADGVLRAHHLARLLRHDATALHVRNFYRRESAERLGEELVRESQRGGGADNWKVSTSRGLESSDVGTLGEHPPYNVAAARDRGRGEKESSATDDYFEGVQREFRSRRRKSIFAASASNDATPGYGSHGGIGSTDNYKGSDDSDYYQFWPLDKLRLELEEAWPGGAGLAREPTQRSGLGNGDDCERHPRPFGGGLPRIMRGPTRWRRGFVHVDELGPLDAMRGLFSANIYLAMPNGSGTTGYPEDDTDGARRGAPGGLCVWPLGVRSRLDWYRNAMTLSSLSAQDPEMQLQLQHVLGKPNVIIPEPGDLVLLCAQRVSFL
ncbi:hypothetical protein ACHAWF_016927 [Thalassiosira exigua]